MAEDDDMTTGEEPEAAVVATPEPAAPAPTATPAAVAGDVPQGGRHNGRKVREGIVSSASMEQTVVVTVTSRVRHPLYRKTLQHTTKLYAHDADNTCRVGDRVRVAETRPLSKLKRWRLLEVLERAK
jgi:small subunit ribosomal protein S17